MSGRLHVFRPEFAVYGCSLRAADGANPVAGEYDWTALGLTVELLDSNNGHSSGSSDWTVPKAGWWLVTSRGSWYPNASGHRAVTVQQMRSGAGIANLATSWTVPVSTASIPTIHGGSELVYLQAADVLRFYARQQGSGAIVGHYRTNLHTGSGFDAYFVGS